MSSGRPSKFALYYRLLVLVSSNAHLDQRYIERLGRIQPVGHEHPPSSLPRLFRDANIFLVRAFPLGTLLAGALLHRFLIDDDASRNLRLLSARERRIARISRPISTSDSDELPCSCSINATCTRANYETLRGYSQETARTLRISRSYTLCEPCTTTNCVPSSSSLDRCRKLAWRARGLNILAAKAQYYGEQ